MIDTNELNTAINLAIDFAQTEARKKAQALLDLDELNFTYYLSLFRKYKKTAAGSAPVKLFPATDSRYVAYPVGAPGMPAELKSKFTIMNYNDLEREFDGRYARSAVLLLKKLQAGTGSSINRKNYFARRPEFGPDMKIGAKGTDLLVSIPHPLQIGKRVEIPIVELQLLQAMQSAKRGEYGGLILQDITGPETKFRLDEIWHKPALTHPGKNYQQAFEQLPGAKRASNIHQAHVPTVDEEDSISFNRIAPAGHGLFAVEALRAVLRPELLPDSEGKPLIAALANGEDLNSLPDPVMIDWMVKNRAPIVLVTTTKTPIEPKGGILTLVQDQQTDETFLKVFETAEAMNNNQLDVFQKSPGIASTNLTIFNYAVLKEKLKFFSEEELLDAMVPDLVRNWKEQKDADGVTRKYLQLEGTMGTVIMNLDRYYRQRFNEPLVYVINVESNRRTDFFSPVKSAFDYLMQFHSDRFQIDPNTLKLVHMGGTDLPAFSLKDPETKDQHYQDVQNVLDAFNNTSLLRLRDLQINGQVTLKDAVLCGVVKITNERAKSFDLNQLKERLPQAEDGRTLFENVEIRIYEVDVDIRHLGIAHARVSLAGSHTDYNNGLTLASLLPVKTVARVRPRKDQQMNVQSGERQFSYLLGHEMPRGDWTDYLQGITSLLKQNGVALPTGAEIWIQSNIPAGAGISSSAALVTAVLKALRAAYRLPIDDMHIARLGQKVEHYVGARVGLLDQMTISILNQDLHSGLQINFQDMSYQKVDLPDEAEYTIVHSGLTHSLQDTEGTRNYSSRRNQCESAAAQLGVKDLSQLQPTQLQELEGKLEPVLFKRVRHVVSENERVKRFIEAGSRGDLTEMGTIMNESHRSQTEDYDISEKPVDVLVQLLQEEEGVFGAQLTGGGFGGAVVFLTRAGEGRNIAERVMRQYLAHPINDGRYQPHIVE